MHSPIDLAGGDLERREEGGRAIAPAGVCHRAGAALLHGQAGLGAIERLDLVLCIDAIDASLRRRVQLQTHSILQILEALGVGGEFEALHPVGLEPVCTPDAADRRVLVCVR